MYILVDGQTGEVIRMFNIQRGQTGEVMRMFNIRRGQTGEVMGMFNIQRGLPWYIVFISLMIYLIYKIINV
jgi:hypothetical protein